MRTKKATSLSEAATRVDRLRKRLEDLGVYAGVLKKLSRRVAWTPTKLRKDATVISVLRPSPRARFSWPFLHSRSVEPSGQGNAPRVAASEPSRTGDEVADHQASAKHTGGG